MNAAMKRAMVIGCPGSGKSTFAQALHRITGLPLFHLDQMNWNPNRTTVGKPVFRARLLKAIQTDEWIIDGNYGSTMELRLRACDTVFFLDYPVEVCLCGVMERRGKARADMPWIEDEPDPELLEFIKSYPTRSRPEVMELLGQYPHKDIHIFQSRAGADAFLARLQAD